MNRWRVGEDRGSKETDRCSLTLSAFNKFVWFVFDKVVEECPECVSHVGI
jgi:hypothetical protein